MKRKIKKVIILILLLFFASYSFAMEVSFKISGGINSLKLVDINRVLQDWVEWWKKKVENNTNWNFEGEVEKFQRGLNFECELVFNVSRHLAIGIGSGIVYGEIIDKKTEITVKSPAGTDILVQPHKVSAYPLNLTGYLLLPLGKTFTFYLKGSRGLLWATYVNREGKRRLPEETFDFILKIAKAKGTSFEECIGFSVELDPYTHLFIEGTARQAKITGFQRETEEDGKETLFFYEEYDSELDFWQSKLHILAEKPTGENFRSVKEAIVDFSGFSVKIGLIIKF